METPRYYRPVVAVDLDHTLANVLESALEWHNNEKGTSLTTRDATSAEWHTVLGGGGASSAETLLEFYRSTHFATSVSAVSAALGALKPLRKFFFFVAVAERPRAVEKQTREWLDTHFSGVFDKLVLVNEPSHTRAIARKRELYSDFNVAVAVSSDASALAAAAEHVAHRIVVGSVPWTPADTVEDTSLVHVADWAGAKHALETVVAALGVKQAERVRAGPKLAKFTDDLVTVSMRKPAAFYVNIISSKFALQKQETIRLEASDAAIATAVQTSELLRLQKRAVVSKIATHYGLRRGNATGGARVPKIEIVLMRVASSA